MNNIAAAGYRVSEQQRAQYERDGFLVVRGLFAPDEVAEIRERFDAIGQKGEPITGFWNPDLSPEAVGDPLKRYPRVMQPHRFDEMSKRYLLDARVHDILRALLGEEPVAAQTMFYYKPPGAKGQALHQDNFYLHVKPATCMAAWTAIDSCIPDNGCLYIVPGTHKEEIVCPEKADPAESFTTHLVRIPGNRKAVPVEMAPGDTLFFNGSLIHGSPPNRSTTQWRRAFICHYLPKASAQVNGGYKPLLDFAGNDVSGTVTSSTDGGPCGKEFANIGTYGKWH
jgi:phytanoyl-CoA hydroxylase